MSNVRVFEGNSVAEGEIVTSPKRKIVTPLGVKDVQFIAKKVAEQVAASQGGDGDVKRYEVQDIEDIPSEIVEQLKPGDIVFVNGLCYIHTNGTNSTKYLDYIDGYEIIEVGYSHNDISDTWEYAEGESKEMVFEELKGTKLYKHDIRDNAGTNYHFILITTSPIALDFETLNTYPKVNAYLETINVISFKSDIGNNMAFDGGEDWFVEIQSNQGDVVSSAYDDWSLAESTDSVTEI